MEKKYKLKSRIVFIVATLMSLIYIVWRMFFTIPTTYGAVSLVFGIILLVCETVGIFEEYEHYKSIAQKVVPTKPEIAPEDYPDVDVIRVEDTYYMVKIDVKVDDGADEEESDDMYADDDLKGADELADDDMSDEEM